MDEMIETVIKSVKDTLDKLSQSSSARGKSDLNNIGRLFDQVLQSDFSRNNRIRLFCRQLKRLMDNNQSLSKEFWVGLYDYLMFVLNEPNRKQNMGNNWNLFLKRIDFEKELEQRESIFHQTMGEQKSLRQLVDEHKEFFKEYLQKCISLHSKVQVSGLIENIDDFLWNNYGLTRMSLTQVDRQRLQEKLKCIEIPLDYSDKHLKYKSFVFSSDDNFNMSIDKSSINTFLTSAQSQLSNEEGSTSIKKILQSERWIVILGDPGCAKTTLLRWITSNYAKAVYTRYVEVISNTFNDTAVRIPILIRIGEFALWLKEHETKTLIDYIGQHTWFSERYLNNDNGNILQKLIYHGHALILLDGLDEIPEVGRRGEIVKLIQQFIHQNVRDPNFYSAFDQKLFDDVEFIDDVVETQTPKKSGGNQIITTSRIVGYDINSLIGPLITHHFLLLMKSNEVNQFITNWISEVENAIQEILSKEGINIDKQTIETLSNRQINAVKSIFQNAKKQFFLNTSLLTLICTIIFQSTNEFLPKFPIEVYNYAVESSLRSWTNHEPNISKDLLRDFLINLSTYLHLQSPSGLIDTFDITRLSRLTLKQHGITNNRKELREYADKLLKVLESNTGIVAERGLQVFGFQHLSFQEYFVVQSLVKRYSIVGNIIYSIDEIINRIFSFTIDPRFCESLPLALGWISWKWSFDDYNQFCKKLVISNNNYVIPLGSLLFFDALNDILVLPLESIIFSALNDLFNHPVNIIAEKYLIPSLSKLPEDIIKNWMSTYLKDEKYLEKFCQCLLRQFSTLSVAHQVVLEKPLDVVYEHLWLFYNESTLANSVIDQTFRILLTSKKAPCYIFEKEPISYFKKYNIDESNIHPLILSIIIVVCSGVGLEEENESIKIYWSHRQIYRESSIMEPIIEYLMNHEQSHSIKVQKLIKQCETIIKEGSQSNTSVDVIDAFVAIICLQGVLNIFIFQKYLRYQALSMAFDKIKQSYFFLIRTFKTTLRIADKTIKTLFKNTIESIIKMFFSQYGQGKEQYLNYSTIRTSAFKKLSIQWPIHFDLFQFHANDDDKYLASVSEFRHLNKNMKENLMEENIESISELELELLLLAFIPQHLHNLYYEIFVDPQDKTDSLPIVVMLAQCLIHFENVDKDDSHFSLFLTELELQCKEHMLENYLSLCLSKDNSTNQNKEEQFYKATEKLTSFEPMCIKQSDNWQKLIDVECQRILEANNIEQNEDKDCRLFSASISLARLYQIQYNSTFVDETKTNTLPPERTEKVYNAIITILDPTLQIIALCYILDMKDPFIFDKRQRDILKEKMINQLNYLLPCLPLLTFTFLILQRYTSVKDSTMNFQLIDMIKIKLKETLNIRESQQTKSLLIVLKQLKDSYGINYSSDEFNSVQLNSFLLFRCFTNAKSFDSLNTTILSWIYITQLAFDVHVLQIYTNDHYKNKIYCLKESTQQWSDLTEEQEIMTYKTATWITNYLQRPDKDDINKIINAMSCCWMIEIEALPVVEQWLIYRNDEDLEIFAQYAALQLFIKHPDKSDLKSIINEIFVTITRYYFGSLLEKIFNSEMIDSTILHHILIIFQQKTFYYPDIRIRINRQDIFQLILNLELKRIIENKVRSSHFSTKPFLLLISGCSYDLQVYLNKYLDKFIKERIDIENIIKEEYVAVIIKWIIESCILYYNSEEFSKELYDYVFTFLHDQSFHQVQKAILSGLYSNFNHYWFKEDDIFLKNNGILHLERIISSWEKYPKDVLSICLLAYGNLLRKLHRCKRNYDVSNDIQRSLTELFNLSLTIISIRAGFCLIFAEKSFVIPDGILNWFRNKWILTPETEYNILLSRQIFHRGDYLKYYSVKPEEIASHISHHSAELVNTFVCELNNYLDNKCKNFYLSDPAPDYVHIAYEYSRKNFKILKNVLQKNSINKTIFKTNLYHYLYYLDGYSDYIALVELYVKFGHMTEELIQMLKWIDYHYPDELTININAKKSLLFDDETSIDFSNINKLSDRQVIENLFEELQFYMFNRKFKFGSVILKLLIQLANVHVLSLLEVHQQVSGIVNKLPHDKKFQEWFREDPFFDSLLSLSSIQKIPQMNNTIKLFGENDIDIEFEKKIDQLKHNDSETSSCEQDLSSLTQKLLSCRKAMAKMLDTIA